MPNIVIIGGGPAGLSAAIYAVRAGMQATVLYKDGFSDFSKTVPLYTLFFSY